ncbi:MAG: NifB/NifX family molybdenum-iron cluster-binding protein [Candidatus Micrarchaeia archaeon]
MEASQPEEEKRVVLSTIDKDGILTGIGRAPRVAIVSIDGNIVGKPEEIDVKWDELHQAEQEGLHHASIAKFMREHKVSDIIAAGAGPDMQRMLTKLGVHLHFAAGNYRDAIAELFK